MIIDIILSNQKLSISFNPLVPRVQKIKIRNITLNRLIIVEFVKKMVYLGGTNGLNIKKDKSAGSTHLQNELTLFGELFEELIIVTNVPLPLVNQLLACKNLMN